MQYLIYYVDSGGQRQYVKNLKTRYGHLDFGRGSYSSFQFEAKRYGESAARKVLSVAPSHFLMMEEEA